MALPFFPPVIRALDSTGALEIPDRPGRLLVIGGGIIGLEMATVYEALGAQVCVVELTRAADSRLRSRPREAAGEKAPGPL